jgi:hypothetical protein
MLKVPVATEQGAVLSRAMARRARGRCQCRGRRVQRGLCLFAVSDPCTLPPRTLNRTRMLHVRALA